MREIKFRGRGAYQRSVWYVGDLVRCDDGRITIRKDEANEFYVDPETVGQFTGLLDSNGKKIYEGDIVKVDGWRKPTLVEWFDANAQFVIDRSLNLGLRNSFMQVIGNIHDNPELIKK